MTLCLFIRSLLCSRLQYLSIVDATPFHQIRENQLLSLFFFFFALDWFEQASSLHSMSIYALIEAGVLFLNGMAILNEERFLNRGTFPF